MILEAKIVRAWLPMDWRAWRVWERLYASIEGERPLKGIKRLSERTRGC